MAIRTVLFRRSERSLPDDGNIKVDAVYWCYGVGMAESESMPRQTISLADRTHRALKEATARQNRSMGSIPTGSPTPFGASLSPAAMPPARGTPPCGHRSPAVRRDSGSRVTGFLSKTSERRLCDFPSSFRGYVIFSVRDLNGSRHIINWAGWNVVFLWGRTEALWSALYRGIS